MDENVSSQVLCVAFLDFSSTPEIDQAWLMKHVFFKGVPLGNILVPDKKLFESKYSSAKISQEVRRIFSIPKQNFREKITADQFRHIL